MVTETAFGRDVFMDALLVGGKVHSHGCWLDVLRRRIMEKCSHLQCSLVWGDVFMNAGPPSRDKLLSQYSTGPWAGSHCR